MGRTTTRFGSSRTQLKAYGVALLPLERHQTRTSMQYAKIADPVFNRAAKIPNFAATPVAAMTAVGVARPGVFDSRSHRVTELVQGCFGLIVQLDLRLKEVLALSLTSAPNHKQHSPLAI